MTIKMKVIKLDEKDEIKCKILHLMRTIKLDKK